MAAKKKVAKKTGKSAPKKKVEPKQDKLKVATADGPALAKVFWRGKHFALTQLLPSRPAITHIATGYELCSVSVLAPLISQIVCKHLDQAQDWPSGVVPVSRAIQQNKDLIELLKEVSFISRGSNEDPS